MMECSIFQYVYECIFTMVKVFWHNNKCMKVLFWWVYMLSFNFDHIFRSEIFCIPLDGTFMFLVFFAIPICFAGASDPMLIESIAIVCQIECIMSRNCESCFFCVTYLKIIKIMSELDAVYLHVLRLFSNANIFS